LVTSRQQGNRTRQKRKMGLASPQKSPFKNALT